METDYPQWLQSTCSAALLAMKPTRSHRLPDDLELASIRLREEQAQKREKVRRELQQAMEKAQSLQTRLSKLTDGVICDLPSLTGATQARG